MIFNRSTGNVKRVTKCLLPETSFRWTGFWQSHTEILIYNYKLLCNPVKIYALLVGLCFLAGFSVPCSAETDGRASISQSQIWTAGYD